MNRDPDVTADVLTDVAHFVEDDKGWAPIDEPDTIEGTVVAEHTEFHPAEREPDPISWEHLPGWQAAVAARPPTDTRWLPKVPELNPRRRTPNGDNPIFDELDARRETKTRKGWTKSKHRYRVRMTRWQEQYQLEEGAHRDRLWEIEHASPLLNQL